MISKNDAVIKIDDVIFLCNIWIFLIAWWTEQD